MRLLISRSWCCLSGTSRASQPGLFRRWHHREPHNGPVAHPQQLRDRAQYRLHLQGQEHRHQGDQQGTGCALCPRGSVQRDQNHVRVNAQLIDGDTGAHLWADRFEESITDLFKLQDQVVARLANTLGYELVKAEAQRGTHSTNPDAIDLTMRGWARSRSRRRRKALHRPATTSSAR